MCLPKQVHSLNSFYEKNLANDRKVILTYKSFAEQNNLSDNVFNDFNSSSLNI